MESENQFPELISKNQCKKVLQEYKSLLGEQQATRMWRALSLLKKYHYEPQPFEIFGAEDEDELNLQAQWKIASCYYAVDQGEMSMEDALSWIDHIEWAAYTWAYEIEGNESMWPVMIMFQDAPTFEE